MARPGEGEGIGRLAEPEKIYKEILHWLSAPRDLHGVRVLVTAGRTEESWDPVRVLTNRASGRMGFALAEEARERGADVTLIHGPTDVMPPTGVKIVRIKTASDMARAVKQEFPHSDMVLMAAAVSDYTFEHTAENKIKKDNKNSAINLVRTEDILKTISAQKGKRVIVGFALETENDLENALKKLREKHLDIVVANNPLERGAGFAHDTNQVFIIHRGGEVKDIPLQSKREIAREIVNEVIKVFRHPEQEIEPEFEPELEETDYALPGVETFAPATEHTGKKNRGRRGGRRAREARERREAAHKPNLPAPVATKAVAHVPENKPPANKIKKHSRRRGPRKKPEPVEA
jgi:phosphopantothenoylcysteine synthetase/decarboxylase